MGHYKSNLRDIEFNLFEVFGRGEVSAPAAYAEMDVDTARAILAEVERLAVDELAESFTDADRNPPVFDPTTHSATLPESSRAPTSAYMDAEYWRLGLPERDRRHTRPALAALGDRRAGARRQPGDAGCTPPAPTSRTRGRGTWAPRSRARSPSSWSTRLWGATMVLTEPDAGSDVGAGRTKAIQQADGSWHIEGVKRFITCGEHDLTENIIHLVLARPEGAGPGTKGLSLFIVPKFHVDWDDRRARRAQRRLRHQRRAQDGPEGLHHLRAHLRRPSAPAKGWLVGEVHDGIAQMFKIIEFARMMVGTKAIATLSTGYLNALEYAKTRVQGADLTRGRTRTRRGSPSPTTRTCAGSLMHAEGLRRGHARPGALHRELAGPGRTRPGRRRQGRTGRAASTTSCCRS